MELPEECKTGQNAGQEKTNELPGAKRHVDLAGLDFLPHRVDEFPDVCQSRDLSGKKLHAESLLGGNDQVYVIERIPFRHVGGGHLVFQNKIRLVKYAPKDGRQFVDQVLTARDGVCHGILLRIVE